MVKNLILGQYLPGGSILHRADPRTKILLTAVFICIVLYLKGYPALLLLLLVIAGTTCRTGRPLRLWLRNLRVILYLAGVASCINLVTISGTPLVAEGILSHISGEALAVSALMLLKLVLLASAATLLTTATTPLALTGGVEKLLKPLNRLGINVSGGAMMVLIAMRFIPVIVKEAQALILAQSSRGAAYPNSSLREKIRNLLPLCIPLFAGVARRGDALTIALEARCFRGCGERTRMKPLVFSGADFICAGVATLFLSTAIAVEYLWGSRF